MERKMILLGMFAGSFLGGYLPVLLGADALGMASLFGSAAGAALGIWVAYRATR